MDDCLVADDRRWTMDDGRWVSQLSSLQVRDRVGVEALHEGDQEAGAVVEVVPVDHGGGRVDVAGGDADGHGGDAVSGQLEAAAVGAARRHAVELVGNAFLLGRVDDEVAELEVGNQAAVVYE